MGQVSLVKQHLFQIYLILFQAMNFKVVIVGSDFHAFPILNILGYKRIGWSGTEGQGEWGLSVSSEGSEGGVCKRLCIPLLASWCNL